MPQNIRHDCVNGIKDNGIKDRFFSPAMFTFLLS